MATTGDVELGWITPLDPAGTVHRRTLSLTRTGLVNGNTRLRELRLGYLLQPEGGLGLLAWHGATSAFLGSRPYKHLLGGQFVAHPGGSHVEHTIRFHPDPLTVDLPDVTLRSEQYYLLVDPAVRVLATTEVVAPDEPWLAGTEMPAAWSAEAPWKLGQPADAEPKGPWWQRFDDPVPPALADQGLDLVTLMFNYHDLGHLGVDRAGMNAAIFRALKPGGAYVIADHAGRPGTGISERMSFEPSTCSSTTEPRCSRMKPVFVSEPMSL